MERKLIIDVDFQLKNLEFHEKIFDELMTEGWEIHIPDTDGLHSNDIVSAYILRTWESE